MNSFTKASVSSLHSPHHAQCSSWLSIGLHVYLTRSSATA